MGIRDRYRIEEALNLLRGPFKEDSDVIKLQKKRFINNTVSFDEYNREKNRINIGVMQALKEMML